MATTPINYLALLSSISGDYVAPDDPRREVQAQLAARGSAAISAALHDQISSQGLDQAAAMLAARAPIVQDISTQRDAMANDPNYAPVMGSMDNIGVNSAEMPSYIGDYLQKAAMGSNLQAQMAEQGLLEQMTFEELSADQEAARLAEQRAYEAEQVAADRAFQQYMFDQELAWEREQAAMMSASGGGGGGGGSATSTGLAASGGAMPNIGAIIAGGGTPTQIRDALALVFPPGSAEFDAAYQTAYQEYLKWQSQYQNQYVSDSQPQGPAAAPKYVSGSEPQGPRPISAPVISPTGVR